MGTFVVHPGNNEQLDSPKTIMKAFKISFEEEKPAYDSEFAEMIQQVDKDLKAGIGIMIDIDNLRK
jgi:uncharacterized protein DUF2683